MFNPIQYIRRKIRDHIVRPLYERSGLPKAVSSLSERTQTVINDMKSNAARLALKHTGQTAEGKSGLAAFADDFRRRWHEKFGRFASLDTGIKWAIIPATFAGFIGMMGFPPEDVSYRGPRNAGYSPNADISKLFARQAELLPRYKAGFFI